MNNEARYINPLTDFGFKKIFGDEEVMKEFLQNVLELKSPIAELLFLDKEMEGSCSIERGVVYDMRCKTEDGKEFIVEMQNRSQLYFSNRILYYLSRSIASQAEKGELWDFRLHPVYCIAFLNFHLDGFKPISKRTVKMVVEETGEEFTDKMRAYTLELPDYRKMSKEECKTKLDYWLYVLSNMENMTTNIPFEQELPILQKVGGIAELINMSAEDRQRYNISLDTYRTNRAAWEYAKIEGVREGFNEGHAEAILTTAKKLKDLNAPLEMIMSATGLSLEEINKL